MVVFPQAPVEGNGFGELRDFGGGAAAKRPLRETGDFLLIVAALLKPQLERGCPTEFLRPPPGGRPAFGQNAGCRRGADMNVCAEKSMSEFKFACPVCGQHMMCDVSHGGQVMECPTCFQKIARPRAPAADGSSF